MLLGLFVYVAFVVAWALFIDFDRLYWFVSYFIPVRRTFLELNAIGML